LSELLKDDGHPVRAYCSTKDLPPLTELEPFTAVITDYQLQDGEDGLSFAKRYNAAHPHIPVIMITAYSSAQLEHAVARAPYLSLLRKPLEYDDLHRVLHELG